MNILRITGRILAVVFVVAALSAPVAAASTFEERFPSLSDQEKTNAYYGPTDAYLANQGIDLGTVRAPAATPAATPSEGFDWGDAGIGAAAVLAIAAITGGVALEYGRRHRPRPTVA